VAAGRAAVVRSGAERDASKTVEAGQSSFG
jgi:hypothetical protein